MSIKVTRHSKFAMDILAARFAALDGEAKTNDDVIWMIIEKLDRSVIDEVEQLIGEKPKPKRGRTKKDDNAE